MPGACCGPRSSTCPDCSSCCWRIDCTSPQRKRGLLKRTRTMTQVHDDDPRIHMGLPLSHGKLAMWLFLVTEIMFFTALIGTYMLIRNSTQPTVRDVVQKDE